MAEELKEQAVIVQEGEGSAEVKDRGLFDFLGKKETEEKKPEEEDYLAAGVHNIHIEEGYKAEESKKEEEKQHEEEKEEDKHQGLLDKLHRSHSSSSSSSSSDEEEEVEGEGGIKEKIKKKKKILEEKIEGKIHREEHHEEEKHHQEEEKHHQEEEKHHQEEEKHHHEEEKKYHEEEKKPSYVPAHPVEEPKVQVEELVLHEPAAPEEHKKGLLEKIKEKLPGHSKKPAEEGVHVPPPETVEVSSEHVKVQEVVEGSEGKEKKGFLGKIIEKLPGYHKSTGEDGDKGPASH